MKRVGISVLIGAFFGYLYYTFIGCYSGSCSITSSVYSTTAYFAFMGMLVGFIFQKNDKKKREEDVN